MSCLPALNLRFNAPENVLSLRIVLCSRSSVGTRFVIVAEESVHVCLQGLLLNQFVSFRWVNSIELVNGSWGHGFLVGILVALDANDLRDALMSISVVMNILCA